MAEDVIEWFQPPEGWDPTEAVKRCLWLQNDGHPFNAAEFTLAKELICVAQFIEAGMAEDMAFGQVLDRPHDIVAKLDDDGNLEVSIIWHDVDPEPEGMIP